MQTVKAQGAVAALGRQSSHPGNERHALISRKIGNNEWHEDSNVAGKLQSWIIDIAETNLDSPPEAVPEVLASISCQQMNSIVDAGVIDSPELLQDELGRECADEQLFREKLDEYKDKLGGTPNYRDGKPVLKRSHLLFGHALEPIRNWVSKAVTRKWPPTVFWGMFSKALSRLEQNGQTYGSFSQYEYCVLTLESISHIENNWPEITRRLREGDNAVAYFAIKTGWAIHSGTVSPEVLIQGLSEYLKAFKLEFLAAEKNGSLENFFTSAIGVGDVCFEARNRTLQDYVTGRVIYYDHSSSLEEILDELMGHFLEGWFESHLPSQPPSSGDAETWLLNQDITQYWFYGGAGDNFKQSPHAAGIQKGRQVVTKEMIRQYLDFQIDDGNLPE